MGRNKKFDLEDALDKAMIVFWEKGFEDASLNELLEAMGILNGSFYNAFGDKKNLFRQVLDHYNTSVSIKRMELFNIHETASGGIRALFKDFYASCKSDKVPHGCLIANCLNKKCLEDSELKEVLEASFKELIKALQGKIQSSINNGDLKTRHSAKDLAVLIFSHLHGVIKTSNLNISIKALQRQTDMFLEALGL